ncbi:MAG: ribbon-helix-helix domain-containing protein [Halobacteria archaeon]|nr:ribbon-helix-helix domain-containing protein [Halobacteria archaeon]
MSVETDDSSKIDVRVPKSLLDEVDEIYEERGYTSRSEFVRDAIRDAVNPKVEISPEFLEHLKESQDQKERGQYTTLEDI